MIIPLIYRNRIKRVKQLLRTNENEAILLLASAPSVPRSEDEYYPYRQGSNFFYFTGTHAKNMILIVSPRKEKAILIAPPSDPHTTLFDGRNESAEDVADRIDAELIVTKDPRRELRNSLKGETRVFYYNSPLSLLTPIIKEFIETPSHLLQVHPREWINCYNLMTRLRMHKDAHEIAQIQEAIRITIRSLKETVPFIRPGGTEREVASTINYHFALRGAQPAFETIVGSGVSGATLHYKNHSRSLRSNELLLIDCGAELNLYSGDISRTFPVSGKFHGIEKELYEIVLEAQKKTISVLRHGVPVKKVYETAVKALTQGLVDLKVLRGKVSTLIEKGAYRPYFPHGIGHGLGLDVHDIGNLRYNSGAKLEEGMVFTIEPGLYFPKKVGRVPACGVRIEDDVLITKSGYKVLSTDMPKEIEAVESLFGS